MNTHKNEYRLVYYLHSSQHSVAKQPSVFHVHKQTQAPSGKILSRRDINIHVMIRSRERYFHTEVRARTIQTIGL